MRERETSSLPPGWANVKIEDLAAKQRYALAIGPFGSNLKVSDYRESGVPLVFVREIRSEAFGGPKTKFVDIEKAEELAAHAVKGGDLLVTKMGDPPGDTSVYPRDSPPAVITADCIKLTVNESSTPEFLQYWLRAKSVKSIIQSRTQGVAQQKLSLDRFRSIPLPLPPLAEQERIVAKLEELFSELDAGVAALKHAQIRLSRYRRALLHAAVTGELTRDWRRTSVQPVHQLLQKANSSFKARSEPNFQPPWELPASWRWARFDGVFTCRLGKMLDKQKNNGRPHPYLRNASVRWGEFDLSNLESIRVRDEELDDVSIQAGDLIICEGGEPGRCAVWRSDEPIVIQKALHRARPSIDAVSQFFAYHLEYDCLSSRVDQLFTGTTIKHLTGRKLAEHLVALPPVDEQKAILDELETRLLNLDTLKFTIEGNLQRAERLRQSILDGAFRGELVPQDPADEPAEAVLARLRESSAAKAGQKMSAKRSYVRKTKTAAGGA